MRPAVFLDRDGVIVVPYLRDGRSFAPRRLADLRFYPDAAPSLARLRRAGFLLVVATNQPDVGNGLVQRAEVEAMHALMRRELPLDSVKACFHRSGDGCDCRKPSPGMLREAARELGIDLGESFMIGDRASDIAAGVAAGCATIFVDRGYAEEPPHAPDHVVHSLAQAAELIVDGAPALKEAS